MLKAPRPATTVLAQLLIAGYASTDDPEHESSVDQIFDPLDNTVDELNRELNEGY